jgi:hypothetical protein
MIVEVSALCFEEFLPKAVERKSFQNRLARREPVSWTIPPAAMRTL